ncbi:MAG: hypothetical protein JWM41_3183 [Gemmatimonadetes bacterium]|jgi:hypothetical protein|nr:hypothetical protein [Gemmatimonadota bacterium]
MTQLEQDVRFLKRYAAVTTALMLVATVAAFTRAPAHEKFTEIDVERINIVEPNGAYRMVLSNRPRSIGPIYKGKPFGYEGGGRPGIIFFNDEGTENGGLTFTGQRGADGKYQSSTHMSFDQFNQDQVLNLDYADNNGQRRVGFSVNDRSEDDIHDMVMRRDSIMKLADTAARSAALRQWAAPRNGVPLVAQRLFVGRDPAKSAIVNLEDRNGKSRLRLVVDSLGAARIEFLDASGRVTNTLSDASKPR